MIKKIILCLALLTALLPVLFASAMSFEKAAYEEFYRYFDFKNLLTDGETISTATITVKDAIAGTDVTSSMVSNVAPYSGTMVIYKIKGGTAGHSYAVTIRITTTNNQKFSNDYHETFICMVKR